MIEQIKKKIHDLVKKYEQSRDYYRTSRYNETQLRNEFLDPLFEILGWDIRNNSGKITSEREVLLEESLKANASTHSKKPDYTFRLYGERKFFLEAKKPCVDICQDNAPAKQVRRYGYTAGLKVSAISNFEWLYIYDTSVKVIICENQCTDYVYARKDFIQYIGKNSVYMGMCDEVWKNIEVRLKQCTVAKKILNLINELKLAA